MKPVLANLGFILQTAGLIILLAVAAAFFYNETQSIICFFITSVAFLSAGFLLNALSERKELDFKSSCILITLTFFLLGAIGSIPYLYSGTFQSYDFASKLMNSFFESVSGYTTTGLTFITNPDALPRSMIFYRSLTQWIGGIGIVFIFLAFFYSEEVLNNISKAIGFNNVTSTLKKSYMEVFLIYLFYTLIFIGIFYLFGLKDMVYNASLAFGAISTGGFSPINNFSSLISFPNNFFVIILMIFGGISFNVHHKWFSGKFKSSISTELIVSILIIFSFTIMLYVLTKIDISTVFFHVASASTTTGYGFMDMESLAANSKMLFIFLMFIGGSAFSTAGGVKIMRILVLFKSIPWIMRGVTTGNLDKFTFEGKEMEHADILSHLILIMVAAFMIFGFAFIFTLYGFSLIDSIFELTSAFATTGLSVGITSISLPIILKMILSLVMILGRVEIIAFLVALTPKIKSK